MNKKKNPNKGKRRPGSKKTLTRKITPVEVEDASPETIVNPLPSTENEKSNNKKTTMETTQSQSETTNEPDTLLRNQEDTSKQQIETKETKENKPATKTEEPETKTKEVKETKSQKEPPRSDSIPNEEQMNEVKFFKANPSQNKPKRLISLKRGALFGSSSSPYAYADHEGGVKCVSVSPDGRQVCSGDDSNCLIIRAISSGDVLFSKRLKGAVWGCAFSPNGKHLVSGDASGRHLVWDVLTKKLIKELEHPWSTISTGSTGVTSRNKGRKRGGGRRKVKRNKTMVAGSVHSEMRPTKGGGVSFDPSGKFCAISDFTDKVHLLSVTHGYNYLHSFEHNGGVFGVDLGYSKETNQLMLAIACLTEQQVIVRELPSCNIKHVFQHTDDVNCVVFSKDGSMICAGDDGNNVTLRNSSDGRILHTFAYKAPINSISFSHHGQYLAV